MKLLFELLESLNNQAVSQEERKAVWHDMYINSSKYKDKDHTKKKKKRRQKTSDGASST